MKKPGILIPLLLVIAILTGSLIGCTGGPAEPATKTVTDMAGRTVTLPKDVENIVVLFGPGYEKLVMLGAEDKIDICADYHKTHCAWAHVIYKKLDTLTAFANPTAPNVEELLKYDPDVVFWFGKNDVVTAMENAGIPVICSTGSTSTSIEYYKELLGLYAKVIGGKAENIAADYNKYFDSKLNAVTSITSSIAAADKPKVYVTSGIPLRTRGGTSIMRDTVEKAGGIYIAADAPQGTVTVNYEQMLAWNPDIIIIDHAPDLPDPSASATSNTPGSKAVYDEIMNDPMLQSVNAVKNNQVYISPTGAFFWDAGQQGILQLVWMAQVFYPDKFKNTDMAATLKDFYSKFFKYNLSTEQINMILKHDLPPNASKWGY